MKKQSKSEQECQTVNFCSGKTGQVRKQSVGQTAFGQTVLTSELQQVTQKPPEKDECPHRDYPSGSHASRPRLAWDLLI